MVRCVLCIVGIAMSYQLLSARVVTGYVCDNDSIPVEFANITAFAGDSVVGGGISDATGLFSINAHSGCNRLRISFVGYDDVIVSPVEDDLGKIVIRRSQEMLGEVVVEACYIRREADRVVLNVVANPLSANKDAHELLRTAPGVWATDDSMSIYGQGGTAVYIDDRRVNMSGTQLMTYLKSIQSSSISTIEIIPKAGAEYSADSSGGVIMINLKRSRIDGVNGSAGINSNCGEYKQWISPFVNVSMHSGKWTVNINGNLNGSPSDRRITHEVSASEADLRTMTGVSRHDGKSLQGYVTTGLFYEPTDMDRIGLQFELTPGKSRHVSDSRTEILVAESAGVTSERYVSKDCSRNFSAALNWSHAIDGKGSVLKLISNYDRLYSSMDEDNVMRSEADWKDSAYTVANVNRYDIFVTELSLCKVLGPKWSLNAGAKYTFNDVTNTSTHQSVDASARMVDDGRDYDISYDENIAAVYLTVNGQTGKWKYKAGVRGEYFRTKGFLMNYDRFDLFPSMNVAYSLNEKGDYTVALGYHRNIRRPSFWSLSPVVRQVSDYSYTVGNPSLTSSITDAVSLDFVIAGRYTIALGCSHTDSPIRQMFISNPDYPERMYLTWGNEGADWNTFIHGDGAFNINKWWNIYTSATYVVASQRLSEHGRFDTFGYVQLVASSTFRLPKGFNVTMNCFYNSKMKVGNISVYPIFNLNPMIQKRFSENWIMSLGMENILQRKSRIRTCSSGYNRLTYTKSYATVKLGVTYNFNSGKRFRAQKIEKNTDGTRLSKE